MSPITEAMKPSRNSDRQSCASSGELLPKNGTAFATESPTTFVSSRPTSFGSSRRAGIAGNFELETGSVAERSDTPIRGLSQPLQEISATAGMRGGGCHTFVVVDLHHLLLAGLPAHFDISYAQPGSPVSVPYVRLEKILARFPLAGELFKMMAGIDMATCPIAVAGLQTARLPSSTGRARHATVRLRQSRRSRCSAGMSARPLRRHGLPLVASRPIPLPNGVALRLPGTQPARAEQ